MTFTGKNDKINDSILITNLWHGEGAHVYLNTRLACTHTNTDNHDFIVFYTQCFLRNSVIISRILRLASSLSACECTSDSARFGRSACITRQFLASSAALSAEATRRLLWRTTFTKLSDVKSRPVMLRTLSSVSRLQASFAYNIEKSLWYWHGKLHVFCFLPALLNAHHADQHL